MVQYYNLKNYTYKLLSTSSSRYLDLGWYRFTGPQGGDMVNELMPLGSCSTAYPIWMNGNRYDLSPVAVNIA